MIPDGHGGTCLRPHVQDQGRKADLAQEFKGSLGIIASLHLEKEKQRRRWERD